MAGTHVKLSLVVKMPLKRSGSLPVASMQRSLGHVLLPGSTGRWTHLPGLEWYTLGTAGRRERADAGERGFRKDITEGQSLTWVHREDKE